MDVLHPLESMLTWLSKSWVLFGVYWAFLAGLAIFEVLRPAVPQLDRESGRLRTNFAFALMTFVALASLPMTVIAAAAWAQANRFGLFNIMGVGPVWGIALAVLAYSFLMYWLHRAFHEVRWLWPIHAVHHSDTAIDLSTYFRAHPIAIAFMVGAQVSCTLALGLSPVGLLLYEMAFALCAPWQHANVATSPAFERMASRLIVTPGFHHVHHSADEPRTNSNYGDLLTLWDRVFGTVTPPDSIKRNTLRIGLGDAYDAGSSSLLAQLALPFRPIPLSPTQQSPIPLPSPVRQSADRE